ncbi:MAG: SDR family NAD(P)-dependent oxidoreductase, partial [Planctomycetota bacterium]
AQWITSGSSNEAPETSSANETELVHRDGVWHAPRLGVASVAQSSIDSADELVVQERGHYRVRLDGTDRTEGLWAERMPELVPLGNEVLVAIDAVGLNFSDVLKSMGLYPGITDDVVPMGIEVCGRVMAMGPDVTRFRLGQRVMGIVPHGFSTADKTNDYLLSPVPAGLSDEEAASLPIVFMTAHHALCHLAQLERGESVLIHAGAGGVGLAAIQIAQSKGATIYSTAGSEHKRRLIAAHGVPAENIFDSRDLSSIERIRAVSGGVDVVLNSLPGEWIDRSLSLLKAHGRFLEIGKIDIYGNHAIGLLPFQNNLSYHAIDLDRLLRHRPEQVRRLHDEITARFESGVYRALPITRYRLSELPAAMRYMAARRNIGKIVVRLPKTSPDVAKMTGTHVITGGSGAIGLGVARRLVERGAKAVDLIARRPPGVLIAELIAFAKSRGSTVTYHQDDLSDGDALTTKFQVLSERHGGIAGVIHAAGVLSDGLLSGQTSDRLSMVLKPKVDATLVLHQATRSLPLQYFSMVGSVATVFGSPAQSNYSAANAFLEGLAAMRRSQALPATVVHWGPWQSDGRGGMAADAATKRNLDAMGLRPLSFAAAVDQLIDAIPDQGEPKVIVDVDWKKLLAGAFVGPLPSRLRELKSENAATLISLTTGRDEPFLERLATSDEPARLVLAYLADQLGQIMGMPAEAIDPLQPLGSLGLDSLMAIELKNTIETKLDVELPISKFVDDPSLSTLADAIGQARS